jgi:transcriptional regulator with XRE-family HTH domain
MTIMKRKSAREIGRKLKEMRQQEKWSKRQMADKLGLTASGYHKNESGLNSPCIETLHRLWEKFDISMNWLFFDDGPRFRKDIQKGNKELEQTVKKLQAELAAKQERASSITMQAEVKELLQAMEQLPVLYHDIMLRFQKFKLEYRDLLEPLSGAKLKE